MAARGISCPIILDGRPNHQAYYRLTFSIKPFANIICNYTCRDGKKKGNHNFQDKHLLPVASIGVGNMCIITEENKLENENNQNMIKRF